MAVEQPDEGASTQAEVEALLVDLLQPGPTPAKDAEEAILKRDHSKATLRRAKKALGVVVSKEGNGAGGRWMWHLPPAPSLKVFNGAEDAR